MTKYDRVFIGDFVIYFEDRLRSYASLIIDKDDKTQHITVDEIFMGKPKASRRRRYLDNEQWELCDEHSQNSLHQEMLDYADEKLPEKLHYIRLIKLKKLRKKLSANRESKK